MKKLLVLIALLMIGAVTTQAAVVIWTGDFFPGGDGDYANGLSWTADEGVTAYGTPPLATDSHGLISYFATLIAPTINSAILEAPIMLGIGWDLVGDGVLNVVDGGSITANNVSLGVSDLASTEGVLNIDGGTFIVAGSLTLGWIQNFSGLGTINQSAGVLHLASPPIFNNGVINLSDTAFFLINGDQRSLDLVGNGYITAPTGETVAEVWNEGDGRTEYTVVPEPATLGFLAILGLAFLRRK